MRAPVSLKSVYNKLVPGARTLFVVPLIRYKYPKSDYLYLFYKEFIESNDPPKVSALSVFGHFKFVFTQLFGKPCILHYHWLEFQDKRALAGMIYKWFCLYLYKLFGGKLVWTVHNKMPHDNRFYKGNFLLRKWMAKNADLLHVHCDTAIYEISDFFNITKKKFFVISHPKFPAILIPRAASAEALNQRFNLDLKSSDKIYLCFGNISAYKQLPNIANIFKKLEGNKKLIIAGPVKKGQLDEYKALKEIKDQSENIFIIPQFISEECVPEFFNTTDFVVFNYSEILTSGGVELAKSYRKKIILPLAGCLSELKDQPNIISFTSQKELEQILQST
ncbi:MAG: hypothetical protein ACFCU6_02650 [Balneolaceae bacterium]